MTQHLCLASHQPGWEHSTSAPIRKPGKPETYLYPPPKKISEEECPGKPEKINLPKTAASARHRCEMPEEDRTWLSVTHSNFTLVSNSHFFELWSVRFNFTSKLFIPLNTPDSHILLIVLTQLITPALARSDKRNGSDLRLVTLRSLQSILSIRSGSGSSEGMEGRLNTLLSLCCYLHELHSLLFIFSCRPCGSEGALLCLDEI